MFFLGGDSQHPKTEEAVRQIGVRLGFGQSQVRCSGKNNQLFSIIVTPPATVLIPNTDKRKATWWTRCRFPDSRTRATDQVTPTYTCFLRLILPSMAMGMMLGHRVLSEPAVRGARGKKKVKKPK